MEMRRVLPEDLHPTRGLVVSRKASTGRISPTDSDANDVAWGGLCDSDWCSGFLTSRLVLAFFKTSCVLVTETMKQPSKKEITSRAHTWLGCVFLCVSV